MKRISLSYIGGFLGLLLHMDMHCELIGYLVLTGASCFGTDSPISFVLLFVLLMLTDAVKFIRFILCISYVCFKNLHFIEFRLYLYITTGRNHAFFTNALMAFKDYGEHNCH